MGAGIFTKLLGSLEAVAGIIPDICEMVMEKKMSFIFTCKPDSHPWLTETAENSFLEEKDRPLQPDQHVPVDKRRPVAGQQRRAYGKLPLSADQKRKDRRGRVYQQLGNGQEDNARECRTSWLMRARTVEDRERA